MTVQWRRWAFVGVSCMGLAWHGSSHASGPLHDVLQHLPSCQSATWLDACRIHVPNAEFSGPSGDNHYHDEFTWAPSTGRRHGVAEHIAPWTYTAGAGSEFHKGLTATTYVTLYSPGDRIVQKMGALTAAPMDMRYTLVAYVRGTTGPSDAAAGLVMLNNEAVTLQSIGYTQAAPGRGAPVQAFVTHLLVPAGTDADTLVIALGAAARGVGPVIVDDVMLVRAPADVAWEELVPVR